jgi:hypothetical protein
MLAGRVAGLSVANPWQQPSEEFDVVYVESDFSRDLLLESRYPAAKIDVAGKPLLDAVVARTRDAAAREAIYASLGLAADTPFALLNVEPTAEHRYSDWDSHWRRLRQLLDGLRSTGVPAVLSLHWLCTPADYAWVTEEYGFAVPTDLKIVDLYPLCGVSVTFPCSTNVLAPLFRKPLVIYDFLGLTREGKPGSTRYRIPGADYVYDYAEIAEAVLRTTPATADTNGVESHACVNIERDVRARLLAG